MTQTPGSPESDLSHETQHAAAVSAAACVLARLIARQAAGEFLKERVHGDEGSDHDAQDEQAG